MKFQGRTGTIVRLKYPEQNLHGGTVQAGSIGFVSFLHVGTDTVQVSNPVDGWKTVTNSARLDVEGYIRLTPKTIITDRRLNVIFRPPHRTGLKTAERYELAFAAWTGTLDRDRTAALRAAQEQGLERLQRAQDEQKASMLEQSRGRAELNPTSPQSTIVKQVQADKQLLQKAVRAVEQLLRRPKKCPICLSPLDQFGPTTRNPWGKGLVHQTCLDGLRRDMQR